MIYVLIVGGTTPSFFNKDKEGEASTTIESVFDVASDLLHEGNTRFFMHPNYITIATAARKLADADIQQTSIEPVLRSNDDLYESEAWTLLFSQFYSS